MRDLDWRSWFDAVGPRHRIAAARAAAVITAVGAVVTATFAVVSPAPNVPGYVNAVSPLVLVVATYSLLRARDRAIAALCLLVPLIGVALIVGLDLVTKDASASAQVFFCLPVLYAGSQLRVAGIAVVTASALAGTTVVSLALEAISPGITDVVYVGVTLVLTAVLLGRAGIVQDHLTGQLVAQAAIDPLTGLVTRRVLDDAVRLAISSAAAHTGTALVLVDVDRFKAVNDTYGHPVGDDALSHIASVLTACSRSQDVVARMGGDELALLMPGCSYDDAVSRAGGFVHAVQSTPLVLADGSQVELSISVGVAHAPEHAYGLRELYASADRALYGAKRNGGGRVGEVPFGGSRRRVDRRPI